MQPNETKDKNITLYGINLLRSKVLYRAAQGAAHCIMYRVWPGRWPIWVSSNRCQHACSQHSPGRQATELPLEMEGGPLKVERGGHISPECTGVVQQVYNGGAGLWLS